MSVWLTPDLHPIYGGTYFPPTSRWGRPGFVDALREIARLWKDERERVQASGEEVSARLAEAAVPSAGDVPGEETLRRAVADFAAAFDRRFGGFGGAPKFPRPSELLFLLREHCRTGNEPARDMVVATLRAMAAGGIHDHVGGGFHRYAVDAQWRVPHFEKMLYDQAQLALAYLEAAQATGDTGLLAVAEDTLRYVQRDMTDADGGFFSAEDADSLPPGASAGSHKREGAFYIWSAGELDGLLEDDSRIVKARFGVEPAGNALQDPQGEFADMNVLYAARTVEGLATELGLPADAVHGALERARGRLAEARGRRPRPHLDDKVLAGWNGLMIAAFARASRVAAALGSGRGAPSYLDSARRSAAFVRERMWQPERRRLLRRYREGDAAIDAYAEDYAALIFGLLELFEADADPGWLEWAIRLQATQDELFWDTAGGGWFATTGDDPAVTLRLKEDYDGAEPAASSLATMNLLRLTHLAGDEQGSARIMQTLRLFAPRMERTPRAVPMMLAALSAYQAGVGQVVVVAPDPGVAAPLLAVVGRSYLPFSVLVRATPGSPALERAVPGLAAMRPAGSGAMAYVCRDFACQEPTGDPHRLAQQLAPRAGGSTAG